MLPKLTDTITVMAVPREPSFPSKYSFFLSQLHERKIDINSKSVPTNITFHSLQIFFYPELRGNCSLKNGFKLNNPKSLIFAKYSITSSYFC